MGLWKHVLLALGAVLAAQAAEPAQQFSDPVERGNDHYFNLEYDEAIAAYREALRERPEEPSIYNHIATSILYKELHRLGKLETSAFKGDNQFLIEDKPEPDPAVRESFYSYIYKARELAEQDLKQNPNGRMMLLALAHNYGLEANYQFMIEKSYLSALRNGQKARKWSNELIEKHPSFIDGYLVAGIQEYVVGSLPWAVRALIALGGISGNKEKGEKWVAQVAEQGRYAKTQARVLLVLLHRRESRPLEAARLLETLIKEFPRNYVLRLELGAMYVDADEKRRALNVFREALAKHRRDDPGYGRMPQRAVDALQRKIKSLQEELTERAELQPAQ